MSKNQGSAFIEKFEIAESSEGSLAGLSFAVKDNIDIKNYKTSLGNPTWRDTHSAASTNAHCVEQLLSAGATCKGKTVTTEFARGLTGVNVFYGTPENTISPDFLPGGSSSGSASVVASGEVDFALGTDSGGSIRVPASYCGIYGMRPSSGRISLKGFHKLSPSFDTVGVFSKKIDIVSKVMSLLLDQKNSSDENVGKIYVCTDFMEFADEDIRKKVEESLAFLKEEKKYDIDVITRRDIDTEADDSHNGWDNTFKTIIATEMWDELGPWIKEVKLEYGKTTFVDFSVLENFDRSKIKYAMMQFSKQVERLNTFLSSNRLLCMPTVPFLAPKRPSSNEMINTDYERLRPYTCVSCVGRLPQVSIPIGTVKGRAVGLSFMAAHAQDDYLLAAMKRICHDLSLP